jgi:hypothetical protein
MGGLCGGERWVLRFVLSRFYRKRVGIDGDIVERVILRECDNASKRH